VPEDSGSHPPLEVRSYRTVFELERRVYRIDRIRLPPGGVPMRGAIYCIALVLFTALVSTLPFVRVVAGAVPWYLGEVALPLGVGVLLALVRIEGRPFHLAVRSLVRQRLGPRWWRALRPAQSPRSRWYPGPLLMLPDGSDGRWRAFVFTGPGAVMVAGGLAIRDRRRGPFGALLRRPHITVRELPDDVVVGAR